MNNLSDPAQLPLRDIHLPAAVSWWPPALGWWLLAGLALFLLVAVVFLLRRRKKYLMSPRYQSRLELIRLKEIYAKGMEAQKLLSALSILIKRVAISVYPRQEVASLSGVAWLEFLDQATTDRAFSEGPGRALLAGPYQSEAAFDAAALFALTERWIIYATEK